MKNYYTQLLSKVGLNNKQAISLMVFVLLMLAFLGGMKFYDYRSKKQTAEATTAFDEALKEFNKTLRKKSENQNWKEITSIFDKASSLYVKTPLAPYFLAYKAEALIKDNNLTEAIKTMAKVVAATSVKNGSNYSQAHWIYATKLALMKLDSPDTKIKQEGKRELESLAKNIKNLQRDMALYYAGAMAVSDKNPKKAKEFWSELSINFKDSPWAKEVKLEIPLLQKAW